MQTISLEIFKQSNALTSTAQAHQHRMPSFLMLSLNKGRVG